MSYFSVWQATIKVLCFFTRHWILSKPSHWISSRPQTHLAELISSSLSTPWAADVGLQQAIGQIYFPTEHRSYRVMLPFSRVAAIGAPTGRSSRFLCLPYPFISQEPSPKPCVNTDQMLCWLLTHMCGIEQSCTCRLSLTPPASLRYHQGQSREWQAAVYEAGDSVWCDVLKNWTLSNSIKENISEDHPSNREPSQKFS